MSEIINANGDAAATTIEAEIADFLTPIADEVIGQPEETTSVVESTNNSETTPVVPEVKPVEGGEPSEGTPVVTPVATVTPGVETSVNEVETLKAQIASLTALVESMAGKSETKAPETPEVGVKVPETVDTKFQNFIDGLDFDEVMSSKESFMKFFTSSLAMFRDQATQQALISIPEVVGSYVTRQAGMKDVATEFYNKYPELANVKKYVAHVANEVSAENPALTVVQVLDEAAKRTKVTLNLQNVVAQSEQKSALKPKPVLPGGSQGSKVPTKAVSGLQSEIDALIG